MKNEQNSYTTSLGKTVEIVGVSPLEVDEVRQLVPIPEAPTRAVPTAVPGFTEMEPLTADSLLNDEERTIWARYDSERRAAERQRNELVTNFLLLEGTRFDIGDLEQWKSKRKRWRLSVPDDEQQLQIAYYRTAIIGSVEDINAIIGKVMARQGVDEATLKQVQSTFQRALQRNTAGAVEPAEERLELQPALSGDTSGQGMGGGAAE